jgi:hypothetical protein
MIIILQYLKPYGLSVNYKCGTLVSGLTYLVAIMAIGDRGLRMWDLGLRIWDFGFRIWDFGIGFDEVTRQGSDNVCCLIRNPNSAFRNI